MFVNLLRTLESQTRRPDVLAMLNFGAPCPELKALSPAFRYIYRHAPHGEVFSLSRAHNQAASLLPPVETVMFLDADVLLAPDFIERGLRRLKRGILVNCRIMDLPREAVTPETDVVREFERLKTLSKPRRELTAVGACQWLWMNAYRHLRGHDEAFKMWCFEDMDFQRRARWMGLQPVALDEETTMLHQWHLSKDDVLKDPKAPQVEVARYWYKKNLSRLRNRAILWDIGKFDPSNVNPDGWGKLPPRKESVISGQ